MLPKARCRRYIPMLECTIWLPTPRHTFLLLPLLVLPLRCVSFRTLWDVAAGSPISSGKTKTKTKKERKGERSLCLYSSRHLTLTSLHLSPSRLLRVRFKSCQPADQGLIQHPDTRSSAALPHSLRTAYTCNKAGQSDPIRSNPLEGVEKIRSDPGCICPLVSAQFN